MSDLDVSQSVHVDKMKELSKEFADGYNGILEKLVLGAQDRNLPPFETIRSVADEMLAEGPINWGTHCGALHICAPFCEKSMQKSTQIASFVRIYSTHQNECCY